MKIFSKHKEREPAAVATATEELEFRQQLIKPGISYIYLCFFMFYFAFGGFYLVDYFSGVHSLLNNAQTLRLTVIAIGIISHATMATTPQAVLLRNYNKIASFIFIFFSQISIYSSYISRVHAAPTELYWSLTSTTVIATIAIYGFARLPILITAAITVSGLVASLIYMMQSPVLPSHIARFLVHTSIAHVVGVFLHTSIERRERTLFFLGIENARRSATERMLAQQAEEALKEKLLAEAATNAKDRFLATLSHELRTPMNAITQSLVLLPNEVGSITQRGEEIMGVMKTSSKAYLELLNDLLDYARLNSGNNKTDAGEFDVRTLAQDSINLFKGNAQLKKIQLLLDTSQLKDSSAHLIGDRQKIRQILLNLLGNAIKFTNIGSVICKVNVLPTREGQATLLVSVTDTGIGIPTDYQPQLFTPFTQADNTDQRKAGGVGLGLAITKGLVTALGGDISFTTSEHGTTFTVTLPVCMGQSTHVPTGALMDAEQFMPPEISTRSTKAEDRPTHAHLNSPKDKIHVLLVEDNAHSSTITMMLLNQLGFTATLAQDGEEAVAHIRHGERFDIVLMDCQMPNMDGYAATRAIRKLEDGQTQQHLPIIALTANASAECRNKCMSAGMDDFLVKPVDSEILRSSILKHVSYVAPTQQ